jgi:hypothetical protein
MPRRHFDLYLSALTRTGSAPWPALTTTMTRSQGTASRLTHLSCTLSQPRSGQRYPSHGLATRSHARGAHTSCLGRRLGRPSCALFSGRRLGRPSGALFSGRRLGRPSCALFSGRRLGRPSCALFSGPDTHTHARSTRARRRGGCAPTAAVPTAATAALSRCVPCSWYPKWYPSTWRQTAPRSQTPCTHRPHSRPERRRSSRST